MSDSLTTVRAMVRSIAGDEAIVEVEQGGCGRCHESGGCGGQHLTQMMCSGPRTFRVRNDGARIGDHVTIAIAAGALVRSATLAYVLPLGGLIVGASVGMTLGNDPGAVGGGLVGLALAWLAMRARVRAGRNSADLNAYIIDRS